jgi:haloalkane dehalogenase
LNERLKTVKANGTTLAYRELGSGPPVVLLHGWPTSSYLWRNVMPAIAHANRVVAPDLPGFGGSDKPPAAAYDFDFFEAALDGLLEALGIDELGLAVHDLGGPVGVHWTLKRPGRVTRLALLNTLVTRSSPTP